jgi:type I restriction enzyme R subunit
MAQTTEKAFETYVMQMLIARGWQQGSAAKWDKDLSLFSNQVEVVIPTGFEPVLPA